MVMSCCAMLMQAQPGGFGGFGRPAVDPQFKNVDYVGDGIEAHQMDIYLPEKKQDKYKRKTANKWIMNRKPSSKSTYC